MTIQSLFQISFKLNYWHNGHAIDQSLNIIALDVEDAIKKLRENNPFSPQEIERIKDVSFIYQQVYV